jgi:hypothetical protein
MVNVRVTSIICDAALNPPVRTNCSELVKSTPIQSTTIEWSARPIETVDDKHFRALCIVRSS